MASNNILPFCPTDTGTNLLTQVAYAAASDRTNGNQPGVASSKLNNKAVRQSSFVSSQIAQYISNTINQDVLDDGNTATLLGQIQNTFLTNQSAAVNNLAILATVGSNALTIAIKTKATTDSSAIDFVTIGMRSSTSASGAYNIRTLSSALSMVISNGSTLGQDNGAASVIYVYLIDNAGALELAVSHTYYPENSLVTTVAEGGSGAADSAIIIYSTTARSNVPLRLVGMMTNTQATAGTWLTVPSEVQLMPSQNSKLFTITKFTSGSGTYFPPAGCKQILVRVQAGGGGGSGSGTGGAPTGGTGGATTLGSFFLTTPGLGGQLNGPGGSGGSAAVTGSSTVIEILTLIGGIGGGPTSGSATGNLGGTGGTGGFGGAGSNPGGTNSSAGSAASANSGAGGGGGGTSGGTYFGGGAGGAGGSLEAIVISPTAMAYSVGASGVGGSGGAGGSALSGGAGGSGRIIIYEYYS